MGAQKVAWSQNRAPNTGITRERVDGIKYMFVKKIITLEDTLNTGFSTVRVRSSNYFEALNFKLVTLEIQLRTVPFCCLIVIWTLEK